MSEKITADQPVEALEEESKDGTGTESTIEETVAKEMEVTEQEGEAAESEEMPSLEEQLEAARAEAAKNLDGWMRAQAEFANARKRMEKQRAEAYVNATAEMVTKLLPVIDDFSRALSDIPDEIADHSWVEGIILVHRKLKAILEGLNVKPIEAVGQPFDPNYHEAIMQEASDEYDSGVVTKELQQGFQLGERVIRPSLVYVAE